jgi:hypothetical protein
MKKTILVVLAMFLLGLAIGLFIPEISLGTPTGNVVSDIPEEIVIEPEPIIPPYFEALGSERLSPRNRVVEDDLVLYDNQIRVYKDNLVLAQFNDTNSMDPLIDKGAHAIQMPVNNSDEISVGDIVAYQDGEEIVLHRIVEIDEDEQGWYAMFKGDNNSFADPSKVRFEQILYVVVGVLY